MKFNWNMYQVKMICSAQALLFPFLLDFKLCPLNLFSFFFKSSCMPHNLVTVWDIFMKRSKNVYQIKIMCSEQFRLLTGSELCFYAYFVEFLYL